MPGLSTFRLGGRKPENATQRYHNTPTIDNQILGSANGLKVGLPSSSDGEATEFAIVTNSSLDHGVPCAGPKVSKSLEGEDCPVESTGWKLDILKRLCRYICFQKKRSKTIRSREASESATFHTPTTQQLEGHLTNPHGFSEPADAHEPSVALSRSWAELNPDLTIEAPKPGKSLDGKLERETAVRNIDDVGLAYTKNSTSPWSPLRVHEQPDEQMARPLETAQVLPGLDILEPAFAEQTNTQGDSDPDRPIIHTLEVEDSQQPQRKAPSILPDVVHHPQPCEFKTTFRMVIHVADNLTRQRVGKLDTASKVDVISNQVVTSLGMAMEPYNGPSIAPLGPPIHPVGQIELDWHVANRWKTYTTKFAVLDDSLTKDFDALLGVDTIKEIGFYKVDNSVWLADVEVLAPGCQ